MLAWHLHASLPSPPLPPSLPPSLAADVPADSTSRSSSDTSEKAILPLGVLPLKAIQPPLQAGNGVTCTEAVTEAATPAQRSVACDEVRATASLLWLHGLGDVSDRWKGKFDLPRDVLCHYPTAPQQPVTAHGQTLMTSWFDIHTYPVTTKEPEPPEVLPTSEFQHLPLEFTSGL
jgi:hypothetical protein